MSTPHWFARPAARDWSCPPAPRAVRSFHETFPGYEPSPLVDLPDLARELGVGHVLVKDESSRFGLPSFKVLGASWAIANVVAAHVGLETIPTWDDLRAATGARNLRLVTATDGNHGRAVARLAAGLGVPATILVPPTVPAGAVAAIRDEGADVRVLDVPYDDTVRQAARLAEGDPEAALVQDTAWPGYTTVPGWIVEGYSTMLREVDDQVAERGLGTPDLLVVPVGVGSLAQAVVTHARRERSVGPAVLAVEPTTAACVLESLRSGAATTVQTADTVMAGLNCGTPSSLGWPVLEAGLDGAIAIDDDDARSATDELGRLGVSSGASGAASLAGARAALVGSGSERRRGDLAVGPDAVIVLLSTEGTSATTNQ